MITSNVHANVLANARVDSGLPDWILRSGRVSPIVDLIFTASRYWLLGGSNPPAVSTFITTTRAQTQSSYAQTASGLWVPFSANTARITDRGNLVEPASTNLIIQSQTLNNAAWSESNATVSADAVTAPDGTVTADKIVTAASASFHQVNATGFTASAATTYTGSASLKQAEWRYAFLNLSVAARNYAVSFDLQTGAKTGFYTGNTANPSFGITQASNGFYRASATVTDVSGGTAVLSIGALNASGDFSAGGTGDGSSGIYAWGAQAEAGAVATSYIPTTAASATRAIDNQAAAGALLTALQGARGTVIISLNNGLAATVGTILGINALIGLGKTAADKLTTTFGGAQTSGNTATWTGAVKVGLRWTSTSVSIVLNGGTIVTAANVPPAVTAAFIGATSGTSAAVNQPITRITAYAVDVSDAAFQALTTP